MANHRRIRPAAGLLALAVALALPAVAAAAIHVSVRVEAPTRTVVQTVDMPFTGTLQGHRLTGPTALGGLVAASRRSGFPVGLQWFDCCGFFVDSIAGLAGDANHYWAFKVNQRLAPLGAGSTTVRARDRVLFYYTAYKAATGATQPTLGLQVSTASPAAGGSVLFTVHSWNDAGVPSPAAGAWVWVNGVGTRVDSRGQALLAFGRAGTFAVRATRPGAIRSQTVWIHAS